MLIMPPAKTIVEKALSADQGSNQQRHSSDWWLALQHVRKHEDAPPVRDQSHELRGAYVSRCMRAAECLCGPSCAPSRRLIDAIRMKFRVWFRKGGPGRRTYES